MRLHGLSFACEVGDGTLADFSVVKFTLEESLSTLFTLQLHVVSRCPLKDNTELLLKKVAFTVYLNGQPQRVIHGIISHIHQGQSGFHRTFYTLTLRPALWLLSLNQDSRIYHQQSPVEILQYLTHKYQLPTHFELRYSHPAREYTTQKRESDLEMVLRLCAEEGIVFWMEGETCVFGDSYGAYIGGDTLRYNPHPQNALTEPVLSSMTLSTSMVSQQVIGKDRLYTHPDYPYEHTYTNSTIKTDPALFSVFESYARAPEDSVGLDLAKYRLQARQIEECHGEGVSNCVTLRPGSTFWVTDHSDKQFNRHWQVISVSHTGTLPQSMEEDADAGAAILTNKVTYMPANRHWRAPFRHKALAEGPEVAQIVGPEGEEVYTNELGQVKVHFHWNRYDKDDEHASCWIRVAQGWNGDGYGFYAVPRIGQEVIVSYLDGDIDRPIITGCVYNGRDLLPLNLPAEKTCTTFRTKTHFGDGFNELRFDDANSHEAISIHAQKDMAIQINDCKNERVGNDRQTTIGHDEKLVVANNRVITVEGQQDHNTTGNYLEKIDASKNLSVAGDVAQKINGIFSLTADGDLVINSQSKITFKVGGNFIVIHSGGININGNKVTAGPSFSIAAEGSPSDIKAPIDPQVLKSLAGSGTPFVTRCPLSKE